MARGVALNLLTSAVTLLAVIALLASVNFGDGAPLAAPMEPETAATVHAFYDAVNAVLRTGDTAPLERIVTPVLTVHGAASRVPPDRNGLKRRLLAIHPASAGTQLTVDEVSVAGDRAVARVTLTDGRTAHFPGARP